MWRLTTLCVLLQLLTGCSNETKPADAARLVRLMHMRTELLAVRLEFSHEVPFPRYRVFEGAARDSANDEYDLTLHVTRDSVHWVARPRLRINSPEMAEEAVRTHCDLWEVVLDENDTGTFTGFGEDRGGRRFGVRAKYKYNDYWMLLELSWFSIEILDETGKVVRSAMCSETKHGEFGLP